MRQNHIAGDKLFIDYAGQAVPVVNQHTGEVQQAIFEYIEVFYNRQRKHSTNGYLPPFKYEQNLAEVA